VAGGANVAVGESQRTAPKAKRRWYQYSLRTLMLVVLGVSFFLSWLVMAMTMTVWTPSM
jgi:TRAP-type C4-dicarboxylate transport system permease small subunit